MEAGRWGRWSSDRKKVAVWIKYPSVIYSTSHPAGMIRERFLKNPSLLDADELKTLDAAPASSKEMGEAFLRTEEEQHHAATPVVMPKLTEKRFRKLLPPSTGRLSSRRRMCNILAKKSRS